MLELLTDSKDLIDWAGVSKNAKERLEEAMCAISTNMFICSKSFEQKTLKAWATEYMMPKLVADDWSVKIGFVGRDEFLHEYNISYSDGKAVLDEVPLKLRVVGDIAYLLHAGALPVKVYELCDKGVIMQLPFSVDVNGEQFVYLMAKHLPIIIEGGLIEKKLSDGNKVWVSESILPDLYSGCPSNRDVIDLRQFGKEMEK